MNNGAFYLGQAGVATNAFDASNLLWNEPTTKAKNKNGCSDDVIYDNQNMFFHFFDVFCSRFTWEADFLKKFSNSYVERLLLYNGFVIGFRHPETGIPMIIPAIPTGINMYGEPTGWNVRFFDGTPLRINLDDAVLIQDSASMFPFVHNLRKYIKRICQLGRTADVYSMGLRKPTIIAHDSDDAMSAKLLKQAIVGNEAFILYNTTTNKRDENTLYEKVPPSFHNTTHNSTDLQGIFMAQETCIQKLYHLMGVKGPAVNKASYRSESETKHEQEGASLIFQEALKCREKAAKEFTELVGEKLTCNNNLQEIYEKAHEAFPDLNENESETNGDA